MRRWGRSYVNAFQSSVAFPKSSSRFYIFYLSLILGRLGGNLPTLKDRPFTCLPTCTYFSKFISTKVVRQTPNIKDFGF